MRKVRVLLYQQHLGHESVPGHAGKLRCCNKLEHMATRLCTLVAANAAHVVVLLKGSALAANFGANWLLHHSGGYCLLLGAGTQHSISSALSTICRAFFIGSLVLLIMVHMHRVLVQSHAETLPLQQLLARSYVIQLPRLPCGTEACLAA